MLAMDLPTGLSTQTLSKKENNHGKTKSPDRYKLFFMALPFLLLCFAFGYLPLFGWIYSFFDYRPPLPLSNCDFVGWKWFTSIVSNPTQVKEMIRVMRNTFAVSGLNLATSILPLIFAVFLTEIKTKWFKKTVQTLTTIPNFISWVLVYAVAYSIFSVNDGFLNNFLKNIGVLDAPVNWLASDKHTWLAMCLWSLWKTLGWSAIMYLAAISGIDPELYEAAKVDGAGRFQSMWHITVPGLMPTFFVLLLLAIANLLNNGFDQYFVFQNALNKGRIEVLDLYVYNIGLTGNNFSFATAVSMLKSLISVSLLLVANGMSKMVRGESIL